MEFLAPLCPECARRGQRTVLAEVMSSTRGLVRILCRGCGRRVWVMSDGKEVRVGMVDRPRKVLHSPA